MNKVDKTPCIIKFLLQKKVQAQRNCHDLAIFSFRIKNPIARVVAPPPPIAIYFKLPDAGASGPLETKYIRGKQTGSVYRAKRGRARNEKRAARHVASFARESCGSRSVYVAQATRASSRAAEALHKACRGAEPRDGRRKTKTRRRVSAWTRHRGAAHAKPGHAACLSRRDSIWPGFLHHPGHSLILNENAITVNRS